MLRRSVRRAGTTDRSGIHSGDDERGGPKALAGAEVIRQLIVQARGRIEILPAGGVGPANALELVARTGLPTMHGSFRRQGASQETADPAAIAENAGLLDTLV